MYCKNCGSKIEDNSRFCHKCGKSIEKNDFDDKDTEIKYDYLKEYIGSNFEKIRNQNFSVATLFFGPIYFLYRKIWFYGFLWIIISFLINFFFNILNLDYYLYLEFAIHLVIAFKFREIYLSSCEESIEKIKLNNKDKNDEELVKIIHTKGGTTIIPVLVYIFVLFIVTIYLVFYHVFNIFRMNFNTIDSSKNTVLDYTIPTEFNKENDLYKYSDDNNSCSIKISEINSNNSTNKLIDIIDMIQENKKIEIDDFKQVEINGNIWYELDVEDSTYYVKINRDRVYIINYSTFKDNTRLCTNLQIEFLNSLKFTNLYYNTL